ncbi:unnamed protein product, partial [Durusdinium trenchii]
SASFAKKLFVRTMRGPSTSQTAPCRTTAAPPCARRACRKRSTLRKTIRTGSWQRERG